MQKSKAGSCHSFQMLEIYGTHTRKGQALAQQPQFLVPRDRENEKLERKILVREIKPSEVYIFWKQSTWLFNILLWIRGGQRRRRGKCTLHSKCIHEMLN